MSVTDTAVTVASILRERARTHPEGLAVVIGHDEITYGELERGASMLAAAFVAAGLKPGDRVATLAPNCREVLESLVAVSAMGAVFVPLNFRYRAHELRQVLMDSRPSIVVVDDDPTLRPNRVELLRSVVGESAADGRFTAGSPADEAFGIGRIVRLAPTPVTDPADHTGSNAGGGTNRWGPFVDARPAHAPSWDPSTRTGALSILYTSGTSAAPKGALVPEAAFTLRQAAISDRLGLRADDRIYSPLPMFHIAGFISFLASMSAGATYVTNRYFDPRSVCASIERHRCRVAWNGFDTILRPVLEASASGAGSLRSVEVDALIGPAPTLQQLEAMYGGHCRLLMIYGSTELGSAACLPSPTDDLVTRTETSGLELAGTTIEILAEDGTILGPDELGEICGRGVAVTLGYHTADGVPDRTGFDTEGWFHSGDLGTRDADGRIRYLSRLKDLIKVGGENVAAAEIEAFLIHHPKIIEVQVVGVPDAEHGEVPIAFVQWAPGADGDEPELREYCADQLSRVRIPRAFRFLTEEQWPRSATKIRKSDLREMFLAQQQQETPS